MLLCAVACMILYASCGDDDKVTPPLKTSTADWLIGVNTDSNVDCDFTMFDQANGNITQVHLNENGRFERMDMLSNSHQDMMTVMFDEDGMIKGFAADELTIVLSNFEGNKADVAYIYKDEMALVEDVAFYKNWDLIKQQLVSPISARSKVSGTRSVLDNFFSVFEDMDQWLRDHQEMFKAVNDAYDNFDFVKGSMTAGGQIVVQGAQLNMSDPVAISKIMNGIDEMVSEQGQDAVEMWLGNQSETVGKIFDARDAYEAFANRAKSGVTWPYTILMKLLANYSDYSDFCENVAYEIIETIDNWNKPNSELAVGALSSGTGQLKATLSWNFYADIDLHAYEPSGSHIYFGNKRSYHTDGFLDVDDRKGMGAVENIFWETPENGTYRIEIDYYGASLVNSATESGNCKVTILYKGVGHVYNIHMEPGQHGVFVASISMPDGTIYENDTRGLHEYIFESKD